MTERRVRTAYDTVAVSYAALLEDALANSPWDRGVLASFAEQVGNGPVLDIGCGPGRVTAHLDALGLDVSGVDLSPGMVAEARRRHPHLRFAVGTLREPGVPDGSLAGALGWYSLIHTPPEDLPATLAALARVLRPGGLLQLAFQVGDAPRHLTEGYGHAIDLTAWRLDPDRLTDQLRDAGLTVTERVVRAPEGVEKTPQCYLLARSGA